MSTIVENHSPENAAAAETSQPEGAAAGRPKKVALLRAEVFLLVLFVLLGMGVWLLVGRGLGALMSGSEPREEQAQLSNEVPWKQDSLAMTESEQKATQDQLIQARLELYRQEAALGAFDAVPRSPTAKTPDAPDSSKNIPAAESPKAAAAQPDATPLTREDFVTRREAAARSVNALIARLDLLQKTSNELRAEVEERRARAAVRFSLLHAAYWFVKTALALLLTLLFIRRLYGWLSPRMQRYEDRARASGYEPNGMFVMKAVLAILLVLIGYEAFEVAGAALAAMLVLIAFLADMPWPDRRGAAQKKL